MGTSTSVTQFARKIEKAGVNIAEAEQVAVAESAAAGKKIMLATMGFTSMRGVSKKGARVGVRYKVAPGANPTALLSYFGPVHLVNNNTKAHPIAPKKKGRGKKAILVGGNPRASANHPGTTGKRFFQHSVPVVQKAGGKILEHSVQSALKRSF